MKFAPRTFKIQWDVHAWSGAVASLPLFVIFYCGIFAVCYAEVSRWQGPASTPAVTAAAPSRVSYTRVLVEVQKNVDIPRGASIYFRLPQGGTVEPGSQAVSVYHDATNLARDVHFDRVSGEPLPTSSEHSRLADELYVMHFFSRLPWGLELSGLVAIGLFVALVSGTVIQWKDLLRQLWQFRPNLSLRVSASDAHKVLGVFGLPFAVMFAWSGALLAFWSLLPAPLLYGVYGGDEKVLAAARSSAEAPLEESRQVASHLPLDELSTRATAEARLHFGQPELTPTRLELSLYGDANARFRFSYGDHGFEATRIVELSGDGRVTNIEGDHSPPAETLDRVLFDLHFARFGGYLVKALYVLLALGVCAVIITGNLIWLERRDKARSKAGNRLLERLTVGVCAGLVLASGLYFVANRVLPASLSNRADVEFAAFLGAWAASVVVTFVRFSPRRWARGFGYAAAASFAAVVVVDAVTRPTHMLAALSGNSASMLGAELLLVCLAASCAGMAHGLR